jgi:hypothetical protein
LHNPWIELTQTNRFVLKQDELMIKQFNEKAKEDFKIKTELMPEPFYGSPNGSVYILALNPGYTEGEEAWHQNSDFLNVLKKNLNHENEKYPNYFFDHKYEDHPGYIWWNQKTRWFLKDMGEGDRSRKLSEEIFCVEYFPYHSRKYQDVPKWMLDDALSGHKKYIKHLLGGAISNGKAIVILRSRRRWYEFIPELEKYENTFLVKNPRNVSLSPGNIAGDKFKKLCGFIESNM